MESKAISSEQPNRLGLLPPQSQIMSGGMRVSTFYLGIIERVRDIVFVSRVPFIGR
jgi:hypothetical protein